LFSFFVCHPLRALHSFPTRRSSDLIPAVVFPYLADAAYYAAPAAPDLQSARSTIGQARKFAPYEAAYAIEAGNYALNLDENGNPDRKSTRLNSSHDQISYAVFCLKK